MPDQSRETSTFEGIIEENLPGTTFKVRLNDGRTVLAYISGRMRKFRIKIVPGDRVLVEMTAYDDKRGRIVRRL